MAARSDAFEYIGGIHTVDRLDDGVLLKSDIAVAKVTFHAPGIVRFRAAKGEVFGFDHSWAVSLQPAKVDFSFTEDDDSVTLESSLVKVRIELDPLRVSFMYGDKVVCEDVAGRAAGWCGERVRCNKALPDDEHYYGFGEKAMPLDRRRQKMIMWNIDAGPHDYGSDPLYQTIPFYIGHRPDATYGIFHDSTWKCGFNMGGSAMRYSTYTAEGGEANYYFIAGPGLKDVVERYTLLTGRMEMPPRWALGNQQSRWSYKDEDTVRRIADRFRELDIPCDVIYLDIHYMNGYRVFTWHPKCFPQPKKLIDDLAHDGFKLVIIIDPGVKKEEGYSVFDEGVDKDFFVRRKDGTLFTGVVWPGETVFPDFCREEVRDWWGDLHRGYMEDGVAGIWNDMNEPSLNIKPLYRHISIDNAVHRDPDGSLTPHLKHHNAYGLLEAMGTHKGILAMRPDERPFILTRSAYSGSQRYAAAWSGDNTSSWSHLRLSIPLLMSMGLSGLAFNGADIGGFIGNCTPELYARWIELGVFYPFCRTHSMLLTRAQEPWSFTKKVTDIARKYITLRYRLLPYTYNLFHQAADSGMPIMRPMVLEFPDDERFPAVDDQFMFGRDFLVAPVVQKDAVSRKVLFPCGEWIDYWTGERVQGPCEKKVDAPLDTLPLYVRAGAIIPCQPDMMFTDELPLDPLTLEIYPDPCGGALTLYEDDGKTRGYMKGDFCTTVFSYTMSGDSIAFEAGGRAGKYKPPQRDISLDLASVPGKPSSVTLNGKTMSCSDIPGSGGDTPGSWSYEPRGSRLIVDYPDSGKRVSIEIRF